MFGHQGAKRLLTTLVLSLATTAIKGDFDTSPVRVNQVGYLRNGSKKGVIVSSSTTPLAWEVQGSSGTAVLSGTTTVYGYDQASQDDVHQVDFSSLTQEGAYKLVVPGVGESVEFEVSPSLYSDLPHEAMNYFYFHRMGTSIQKSYLIDDRYDRDAIHPGDTSIPPYNGWCSTCSNFDLFGSWADAGDFGIYTVNHAISAWTLLNLLEAFPTAFSDGDLIIPESGNSVPDVLDEVDYGSRFVRGMLPSDGGLASHKAHNHAWSAFTITIEGENSAVRSAMGPSTAATYGVARNSAHLARMWHSQGTAHFPHRDVLWAAAKDAWTRAYGTNHIYNAAQASPGPAVGGGDYPDGIISDDEYAAACEMYLTAYALGDTSVVGTYKSIMQSSSHYLTMQQFDWASVAAAGSLSLYASGSSNDLSTSDKATLQANIQSFADEIKSDMDGEGYPSNLGGSSSFGSTGQYPWGSNSFMMNRAIVLSYAAEISGDVSYQDYIMRTMDYMLGVNAMRISYVTGYGEYTETDTHDRWAWTVGQDAFWPRGWLSGGPNNELINDYETPGGVAPAKSYAAPGTAPHAWGSKENTVNWNAPLAWVAWYIENKIVPNLGGCVGNCIPQASGISLKIQKGEPVSITLKGSDYDGTIASWTIVSGPTLGTLSGTAPDLTYTPNANSIGIDTFVYKVVDDAGASSADATVTINIVDCNFLDMFDVPRSSAYPVNNGKTYTYVHVSEDGPNIGGFQKHDTQWTGSAVYQFAINLNTTPYYADLNTCMANQLGNNNPGFSLSGCPLSQLDGDYWINQDGDNEIWVEKNNAYAIVFSNSATPPEFCSTQTLPPATATPIQAPTPTNPPTNLPTQTPTTAQPISPAPTKAPTAPTPPTESPTKSPTTNDYCCTWDSFHCGVDASCNENALSCQQDCGGVWVSASASAMQCIAKFGDCTYDDDKCCNSLSCLGGAAYKQCI